MSITDDRNSFLGASVSLTLVTTTSSSQACLVVGYLVIHSNLRKWIGLVLRPLLVII